MTNLCECWTTTERLCATALPKPNCGCWWDPPSQSKVIGCPVNRSTLASGRCGSYVVEGRAGETCRTFVSQREGLGDIEVTGKLECTMCGDRLVDPDPAQSGTKTGEPCHGFGDVDGKPHDGTWDCGY